MHTNPILICFCSVLYYKNLRQHIDEYKLERKIIQDKLNLSDEYIIRIRKFTGKTHLIDENKVETAKKYNKFIVNKWHVILMIHNNKSLIKYRAHNINKIKNDINGGLIEKVKNACMKCPCCKRNNSID